MIQSMTGYGKAEATLKSGKLTLEIRTLNAKGADISIKSSLLPKDKDLEVRKRLADKLVRGTIDLFITYEPNASEAAHSINADVSTNTGKAPCRPWTRKPSSPKPS